MPKVSDAFKGNATQLFMAIEVAVLALSGIELREIMDHVGWKANATAHH